MLCEFIVLCEFILTSNFSELMRYPNSPYQAPLFPHGVLRLISFRGTTPPLSEFLRIDWISRDPRVGRDGCAGILLFSCLILLFHTTSFAICTSFSILCTSLYLLPLFPTCVLLSTYILLSPDCTSYHHYYYSYYYCYYQCYPIALCVLSYLISYLIYYLSVLLCVLLSVFYLIRCSSLLYRLFTASALLFAPLFSSPLPLVFLSLSLKTTLHFSVNPLYLLVSVA